MGAHAFASVRDRKCRICSQKCEQRTWYNRHKTPDGRTCRRRWTWPDKQNLSLHPHRWCTVSLPTSPKSPTRLPQAKLSDQERCVPHPQDWWHSGFMQWTCHFSEIDGPGAGWLLDVTLPSIRRWCNCHGQIIPGAPLQPASSVWKTERRYPASPWNCWTSFADLGMGHLTTLSILAGSVENRFLEMICLNKIRQSEIKHTWLASALVLQAVCPGFHHSRKTTPPPYRKYDLIWVDKETHVSNTGLGVLSQFDETENEHVIAYASWTLSKAERRSRVTRHELLAVVTFIQHFCLSWGDSLLESCNRHPHRSGPRVAVHSASTVVCWVSHVLWYKLTQCAHVLSCQMRCRRKNTNNGIPPSVEWVSRVV